MLQLPNAVAVTVPKYSSMIEVKNDSIRFNELGKARKSIIQLPKSEYLPKPKMATELSEDECKGLVEKSEVFDWLYREYFTGFCVTTAKESLYSLLRSKGYEPESTLIIFKK